MTAITDLSELLRSMTPELNPEPVVFCVATGEASQYVAMAPRAMCWEAEGLTVVLPKAVAQIQGLAFDGEFVQITLQVHSSLQAVGLTAAFATALAAEGISANVIAGYHHDHIFVAKDDGQRAMAVLTALSQSA
ncbi:ACT domain-containing protein [Ferrimonas senticii]|uniref:ACT domain-containing protein n=1 Tax=Ferrimonas senticii TaxID=394566 RepID=UPI000408F55F|nr:ACT domain-containing protein [Ferrimonas senticii]